MYSGVGEDPSPLTVKEHECGQQMLLEGGMVERNSEKGEEDPQSRKYWVQDQPSLGPIGAILS